MNGYFLWCIQQASYLLMTFFGASDFPRGKVIIQSQKKKREREREKIHPRSPKCVSFRACEKIKHRMSAISCKLSYCSLVIKNDMKIKHIGWVICEKYSYHLCLFPINLSEWKQSVCLQFWSKHSLILESLWPNQSWRWTRVSQFCLTQWEKQSFHQDEK